MSQNHFYYLDEKKRSRISKPLPESKNFSQLDLGERTAEDCIDEQVYNDGGVEGDEPGTAVLSVLSHLKTDKYRVIVLLRVLENDGYTFDAVAIARLWGMDLLEYRKSYKEACEELKKG